MKTVVLICLWAFGCAMGAMAMNRYASTAGLLAEDTSEWPASSTLSRSSDRPTFVIFVHPHCSCSLATLKEVETLSTMARQLLAIDVVFFGDTEGDPNWFNTSLVRKAKEMPGVQVTLEAHEQESQLFKAKTSGQAFLYSPQGRLLFNGGLTSSRGHDSGGAGAAAVIAALSQPSEDRWRIQHANVFGCGLDSHKTHTPGAKWAD